MKTLIVGFSKPKSRYAFFGHLIRWYSGEDYSHCYVKFQASQLVSQASKGMVNFTHEDVFLKENIVVREYAIPVTEVQFAQIARYAIKTAGKKYSISQVFGIMIADFFNLKKNPLDVSKDTFVCSEYLGQILRLLGIKLDKHLSLLSPQDIHLKMEQLYGKKI